VAGHGLVGVRRRRPATLLLLALATTCTAVPAWFAVRSGPTAAGVLDVNGDAVASAGALGVFDEAAYRNLKVIATVVGGLAGVLALALLGGGC